MTKDSIFEFERKVDQPEIYNRNVYINTIKAMRKIADIRKRREDRFWENRMKLARVQQSQNLDRELEKHVDLIENKELAEQVKENLKEKVLLKQEAKNNKGTLVMEVEKWLFWYYFLVYNIDSYA